MLTKIRRLGMWALAILAIVTSVALIIGGTYALFTDSVSTTQHLKAGTLDITLKRTKLIQKELNADGLIGNAVDETIVDFSEPTDANIFGLTEESLIAPMSELEAEMEISNASTVAFNWYLEIVYDGSVSDDVLAEQLSVTVTTFDAENNPTDHVFYLVDGLVLGSDADPIGSVLVGGAQKFVVNLTFLNLEDSLNNLAQDKAAGFDLIVHAIQKVS